MNKFKTYIKSFNNLSILNMEENLKNTNEFIIK